MILNYDLFRITVLDWRLGGHDKKTSSAFLLFCSERKKKLLEESASDMSHRRVLNDWAEFKKTNGRRRIEGPPFIFSRRSFFYLSMPSSSCTRC